MRSGRAMRAVYRGENAKSSPDPYVPARTGVPLGSSRKGTFTEVCSVTRLCISHSNPSSLCPTQGEEKQNRCSV
jgi:hypothetical protein